MIRLSPLDSRLVPVPGCQNTPPKVSDKLEGDEAWHFAAFLARPKRETDYLWGRLDAVERLISLLVGEHASAAYTLGFRAVVEAEAGSLTHIDKVMEPLREAVRELPARLAVQRIRAPAAS